MFESRFFRKLLLGLVCTVLLVGCGRQIWMRYYQAPEGTDNGAGYAVAVDAQGNAVVAGEYYADLTPDVSETFLAKYTANGDLLWDLHWAEEAGGVVNMRDAYAGFSPLEVITDSANNIWLVRYFKDDTYSLVLRVSKFDLDGQALWEQDFPLGVRDGSARQLRSRFDGEGNLYLSLPLGLGALSITTDGGLRWQRSFDDGLDGDGNVFAGTADDLMLSEAALLLLDQDGNSVQRITAASLGFERLLEANLAGDLVVFGQLNRYDTAVRVLRASTSGFALDETWGQIYAQSSEVRLAAHPAGGFCLVTYHSEMSDVYTYYVDSQLTRVWSGVEPVSQLNQGDDFLISTNYRPPLVKATEQGCFVQYQSEAGGTRVARYDMVDGVNRVTIAPSATFGGTGMALQNGHLWQSGAKISWSWNPIGLKFRAQFYMHSVK